MAIFLPERRSSILVEAHVFEDGPKNPLKGISMKLLVAAFCAQLLVAAGRLGSRAVRNGIRNSTLFPWRPCQVVKTSFYPMSGDYGQGLNPLRGTLMLWMA